MKITYEFDLASFNAWSGAVDTKNRIIEEGKEKEFENLMEECYPEGMTETQMNDLLWFEDDWIFEQLGISDEDENEDEEDEEDEDEEDEEDEDKDIERGTWELCPYCEQEIYLKDPIKKVYQVCPNCGRMILPCSLCEESEMNCANCSGCEAIKRLTGEEYKLKGE